MSISAPGLLYSIIRTYEYIHIFTKISNSCYVLFWVIWEIPHDHPLLLSCEQVKLVWTSKIGIRSMAFTTTVYSGVYVCLFVWVCTRQSKHFTSISELWTRYVHIYVLQALTKSMCDQDHQEHTQACSITWYWFLRQSLSLGYGTCSLGNRKVDF
jgi:hypothetical protein